MKRWKPFWLGALALAAIASGRASEPGDEEARQRAWIRDTLRIELVENEAAFTADEIRVIHRELTEGPLNRFVPATAPIRLEKRPRRGSEFTNYGSYNARLRRIRIVEGSPRFKRVFVHEMLHAVAADHPLLYQQFCRQAGWTQASQGGETTYAFSGVDPVSGVAVREIVTPFEIAQLPQAVIRRLNLPVFPSDYSKLGPAEMFAETGAAAIFDLERDNGSDYNLKDFRTTELFGWWQDKLLSGAN